MALQQVREEEFSWLSEPWQLLGWLCWLHPGAGAVRKCQELTAPLQSVTPAGSNTPFLDVKIGQNIFFFKFPQGYFYLKVKKRETSLPIVFFPPEFLEDVRGEVVFLLHSKLANTAKNCLLLPLFYFY